MKRFKLRSRTGRSRSTRRLEVVPQKSGPKVGMTCNLAEQQRSLRLQMLTTQAQVVINGSARARFSITSWQGSVFLTFPRSAMLRRNGEGMRSASLKLFQEASKRLHCHTAEP